MSAVFFSGLEFYYGVYQPVVNNLTMEALLSTSLKLHPTLPIGSNSTEQESYYRIVKFPEYLSVAISRTFFDENTYTLTKDCSHIYINPIIDIQNVMILAHYDS